VRRELERFFGEFHHAKVGGLRDGKLTGEEGQAIRSEPAGRGDLAFVEHSIAFARSGGECRKCNFGLTDEQPTNDEVTGGKQESSAVQSNLVNFFGIGF